ncbi:MAG: hypothetical protein ACQEXJ_06425 [Myxococcota bacterium]
MMRSTPTVTALAAALTALFCAPAAADWTVEVVRSGPHVQNPSLAWDDEGILHMAAQYDGAEDQVVGLWRHEGSSWTDEVVAEDGTWWSPFLAIPSGEAPRIILERFSPQAVMLAGPDGAGGWALDPVDSGVALNDPRLVAHGGTLHAAWVQPRSDSPNDIRYGTAPIGGAWSTEVVEEGADGGADCVDGECTSDGSSCFQQDTNCPDGIEQVTRPLLLVSETGEVHLVYRKGDAVRHAWQDGGTWAHETVATQPGLGSGIAADVDADGALHVAWTAGEEASEPLRYATNASGAWVQEELSDHLAWSTPVMDLLVVDGVPHLFFVGTTETGCFQEVRHVWAGGGKWLQDDVACATVTDTPPDRMASTVDDEGRLFLAYYDHTLGTRGLRMARRLPSEGADVSVTTNVSPSEEVPAGGTISVSALVLNEGPESPVEAALEVAFEPADLVEDVTITNPGADDSCSAPGATLECTLAGLSDGVPRTMFVSADLKSDASGTLTVTASASTVTAEDPIPENDTAAPTSLEVLSAAANVSIEKSGPETAPLGGTIGYTLRWESDGALDAQHVQVVDTLPEGVEFVGATFEPEWNEEARTLTWDMGATPTGVDGEFEVSVTPSQDATVGAEIVNEAVITTTSDQENTEDDSSAVTTTLTEPTTTPDAAPDASEADAVADVPTTDAATDPGPTAPDTTADTAQGGDAGDEDASDGGGGGGCSGAGGDAGAPLAGLALVALALRRRPWRYFWG